MNLQEFRYLAAAAEHREFRRAAETCNVSQSTLSSWILIHGQRTRAETGQMRGRRTHSP